MGLLMALTNPMFNQSKTIGSLFRQSKSPLSVLTL